MIPNGVEGSLATGWGQNYNPVMTLKSTILYGKIVQQLGLADEED